MTPDVQAAVERVEAYLGGASWTIIDYDSVEEIALTVADLRTVAAAYRAADAEVTDLRTEVAMANAYINELQAELQR